MNITFEHHREDGSIVTTKVKKACCTITKREVWVADLRTRADCCMGNFLSKPNLEALSYFLAISYLPGFHDQDIERRFLHAKTHVN